MSAILVIDAECINCDICEPGCPNQAIFFDEQLQFYQIRTDLCTLCAEIYPHPHCQTICPVDCIGLVDKNT